LIQGKKIVVILPAYNAARTLRKTYAEIPFDVVDEVILTDDASTDDTHQLANELNIHHVLVHERNKGYGGNQKTCYRKALTIGADVVIMLHPDYQYTPRLIPGMAQLIVNNVHDVVLGSRILGGGARKGGMPLYKYVSNRMLTLLQNIATGAKLSEYHTGYRAFSTNALSQIDFEANSDGFLFDNQILSQVILRGFRIGEISCPAKYFPEASSISFFPSLMYGLGVIKVLLQHVLQRWGIIRLKRYQLKALSS
jgi:glycosyltransferase involved in cell wall biosynthesis